VRVKWVGEVWETVTGALRQTLVGHTTGYLCLLQSGHQTIASASYDTTISLGSPGSGFDVSCLVSMMGPGLDIRRMAITRRRRARIARLFSRG